MAKKRSQGKRPTKAEVAERIEFCAACLEKRMYVGDIKRAYKKKFGDSPHQTITDYLRRARSSIASSVHSGREHHRNMAVKLYEEIIRSKSSTNGEKIRAQAELTKLVGANAPTKIAPTDSQGNDLNPEQARAAVSKIFQDIASKANS